jgi:flagellar biosynthesis protein FlhG
MIHDQAKELRQLVQLDKRSRPVAGAPAPGIVTAIGGKPGVGTSTLALQLAAAIQVGGCASLLVDADPSSAGATALCRLEPRHTLLDVLAGRRKCGETVLPGPFGIQVLPGPCADDHDHACTESSQARLISDLRSPDHRADVVVIDAGCGSTASARRYWQAADLVVAITSPDIVALMDLYAAIKIATEGRASTPIAIVVNRAKGEAEAADVQGRLLRACQRFLGLSVACAGWLPEIAAGNPAVELRDHVAPLAAEIVRKLSQPGRAAAQRFDAAIAAATVAVHG